MEDTPAGDDDQDGISNFQEYLFATSPVQVSGNPMHVSTATLGDQWGIRLVFPRRASLERQRYDYVISSDFTEWATAQSVSEHVISAQMVDAVQIETVEAFIPSTNRVSGFVRFRWNP